MKLINKRILATGVFERWMEQYPNDKDGVGEKLKCLSKNPDPNTIDEIIGNNSWTRVDDCSECGNHKDEIIIIGEEPDHESMTAYICKDCLHEALSTMS